MSKNFYNLLREKLMEKYKKVMADIKVIQQHLELELAGEVVDEVEFWTQERK